MNRQERFFTLDPKEVTPEFMGDFGPPICPRLESRWKTLLEEDIRIPHGMYPNHIKPTLRAVNVHVYGHADWLTDGPRAKCPGFTQPLEGVFTALEKNPLCKFTHAIGEKNALVMVDSVVYAGTVNEFNKRFYIVRPIRIQSQNLFRERMDEILETLSTRLNTFTYAQR